MGGEEWDGGFKCVADSMRKNFERRLYGCFGNPKGISGPANMTADQICLCLLELLGNGKSALKEVSKGSCLL